MRPINKKKINEIIKKIIKKVKPEKIILFGSCARGDYRITSDIDILIVKQTKKSFVDRLIQVHKLVKPDIPVDFLVYTPEELKRMKKRSFIKKILSEGKVLYEKK